MANPYFSFKQFTVYHDRCAMKVTTDGCLFGAWCAAQLQKHNKPKHLLDIGTGTGLLSLMVAQKVDAAIHVVEIDPAAASQAQENFAASPWKEKLHVTEGNIVAMSMPFQYDAIISNPPFYEKELTSPHNLRNVAHHSQHLTLQALFSFIKNHLAAAGCFYLLLPFKRKAEIDILMQENKLFMAETVIVYPSTAHAPFRMMLKGSFDNNAVHHTTNLFIKDDKGNYTEAFTALLKDYYLML